MGRLINVIALAMILVSSIGKTNYAESPKPKDYSVVSDDEGAYEYDPKSTEEFRMRSGLPNFFSKVNHQDTIRVGYVGGSITAGEDEWSQMTFDWLKARYSQSHFEIVNIAVPGTGVDFGSFRIGTEMLVHQPDMVFIEYRVNGLGGQGIRGPEGMIRHIYRNNPKTDICIVYTISQGMIDKIRNGEQTSVGEVMETAANYYGIPSIDMGVEVIKLLDEGKMIFKSSEPVEGKIVFSADGTHPGDEGDEVYTEVVTRNLLKMEEHTSSLIHKLPEPIDAANFESPTIHTVDEMSKNGTWISVDHDTDPIFKTGKWRSAFVLNKTIKCANVGESVSFKWDGFGVCLTTIPQGDEMTIEVTTDNGAPKEYVLKQNGTDRYGSVMLYLPFIEDGEHTTTVKITKLPNNESFYFGQVYTVDKAGANPTSFGNIQKEERFHIYPNPVNDILTINGPVPPIEYVIYNRNGRILQQGISENNYLDTSEIPRGLYLIKIDNEVARFVKG